MSEVTVICELVFRNTYSRENAAYVIAVEQTGSGVQGDPTHYLVVTAWGGFSQYEKGGRGALRSQSAYHSSIYTGVVSKVSDLVAYRLKRDYNFVPDVSIFPPFHVKGLESYRPLSSFVDEPNGAPVKAKSANLSPVVRMRPDPALAGYTRRGPDQRRPELDDATRADYLEL
jgi:hypothetical protein